MDLTLEVLRTGRARTFADAASLSAGGAKLAFLAPTAAGWVLYPLAADPAAVLVNRAALAGGRPLARGDRLRVGGSDLRVTAAPPARPHAPPAAGCFLAAGGPEVAAADGLLVGSADHAGLRVPAGPGVEPAHALVATSGSHWRLFDVSGEGVVTADGQATPSLTLAGAGRARLGPVEIAFRAGAAAPAGPGWGTRADHPAQSGTAADQPAVAAGETPGPEGDVIHQWARDLCQWLRAALRESPAAGAGGAWAGLRSLGGYVPVPADPERAMGRFVARLGEAPGDRAELRRLAAFLERRGYGELWRFLARELCRLDPSDPAAAREAARAYLELGVDDGKPAADRLGALEKAEGYAARAAALRPADRSLDDLRAEIGAERTILQAGEGRAG